jgi:hypothetical protein
MTRPLPVSDNAYKALSSDASKRKLKPEELLDIILKREYKL